jgi:hypothetical protein
MAHINFLISRKRWIYAENFFNANWDNFTTKKKNHKILRQFSPKNNPCWTLCNRLQYLCSRYVCRAMMGGWSWAILELRWWPNNNNNNNLVIRICYSTQHGKLVESLFNMWLDKPYWVLGNNFWEMKGVTHPMQSNPSQPDISINRHIFWP